MKFFTERRILITAIALYILVVGTVAIMRQYNFQTQTWDMGVFTQTFWNTIHGRVMQNHLEEAPNHLGVHMSPFLFFLVPGFAFFPSPYFFLVIQTIALALGAVPLFLFARRVLKSRQWALLLSIGYLLYPSLHWVNLFDFHEIAFFIPLMLAAFACVESERWKGAIVFFALAAGTKEDAILIVAAAGFYLFARSFFRDWRAGKREAFRRWGREKSIGAAVALACLIFFAVSVKIIMPAIGGGLLRLDRYADLGKSAGEITAAVVVRPAHILAILFTRAKLFYLGRIFLPVAFLPFLSGAAFLFLLVPGLLENLLTSYGPQFQGFYQYDAVLIAGIFLTAVYGLRFMRTHWPGKEQTLRASMMLCIAVAFFFYSPVSPFAFPTKLFKTNVHWEMLRRMVRMVPAGVSVTAPTQVVPHLSDREHAYILGREPFPTDVVIFDGGDLTGFTDAQSFQAYAERYASSPDYIAYPLNERYVILMRKGVSPLSAAPSKP